LALGRGNTLKGLLVPSTLTKKDFEDAYALMDTPALDGNCGDLCGRLCCQEYEPGVGIYLLPGEECMFTGSEDWLRWTYKDARQHGFPPEWQGMVQFVMCKATCPRDRRPIQCRTFPLMPYLDDLGELTVRIDTLTGSLVCPIVRNPDTYQLRSDFRERVLEAWRILAKDPLIRLDIHLQSRRLDLDESSPWRKLLVRVVRA
jgi:hypothetical protein